MKWAAIKLIDLYRYLISPLLGKNCRYYPTCSQYAKISYSKFSFVKASSLTIKRIFKCHPYSDGGIDYPPGVNDENIRQYSQIKK